MENTGEVQPIVLADGTISSKPAEYDEQGKIIPDPSWVQFLNEHKKGTQDGR